MDPIPNKLKDLQECVVDSKNGRVYPNLTNLDRVRMIENPQSSRHVYHPLCCFIKAKFFHNSKRYSPTKVEKKTVNF